MDRQGTACQDKVYIRGMLQLSRILCHVVNIVCSGHQGSGIFQDLAFVPCSRPTMPITVAAKADCSRCQRVTCNTVIGLSKCQPFTQTHGCDRIEQIFKRPSCTSQKSCKLGSNSPHPQLRVKLRAGSEYGLPHQVRCSFADVQCSAFLYSIPLSLDAADVTLIVNCCSTCRCRTDSYSYVACPDCTVLSTPCLLGATP